MKTQHSHSLTSEEVMSLLEKGSLKKTKSRTALLQALAERHGPFSVEELHQFLKDKKLDLVTIYRCLTAFERTGIVRRCDFGDGIARYELQLDAQNHHHHIICTVCRNSENIENCEVEKLEKFITGMGYEKVTHNLEFFGICKNCK